MVVRFILVGLSLFFFSTVATVSNYKSSHYIIISNYNCNDKNVCFAPTIRMHYNSYINYDYSLNSRETLKSFTSSSRKLPPCSVFATIRVV